jgi:hypothetical protein
MDGHFSGESPPHVVSNELSRGQNWKKVSVIQHFPISCKQLTKNCDGANPTKLDLPILFDFKYVNYFMLNHLKKFY